MEQRSGSVERYISLIFEQKGEHAEAVRHNLIALHQSMPQLDTDALHAVYERHGWQSYWRAHIRALQTASAGPCTAYEIGVDDLRLNELDHAFDFFQHALDNHCFNMALTRVDPLFDSVRQDPRYTALQKRMHQ